VRRFRGWAWTGLAGVSLLLCGAACVLWVRSYSTPSLGASGPVRFSGRQVFFDAGRAVVVSLVDVRAAIRPNEWDNESDVDGFLAGLVREEIASGREYFESRLAADIASSAEAGRLGFGSDTEVIPLGTNSPVAITFVTRTVRFPLRACCLLAAVCPTAWVARFLCSRRKDMVGLCPACGYDLRASPARCPKCGAVPAIKGAA
jgi:hypothetical protein